MNLTEEKNIHVLSLQDGEYQTTIFLDAPFYSLGRHTNNSIKLYSKEVSRQHATLIRKDLGVNNFYYLLIDGNLQGKRSQNGILVNGNKTIRHELKEGDIIFFGSENVRAIYTTKSNLNTFETPEKEQINYLENKTRQKSENKISREALQRTLIVSEKSFDDSIDNFDLKRLASFPELSPNPIFEIDFQGNITYINPAATLNFENLNDLKEKHPLLSGLIDNYPEKLGQLVIREVQIEDKFFEQYVHYLVENDLIRNYIFDITDRKNSEEMLRYQALHDSITGLPNREFFYQQLNQEIERCRENNRKLAVLFIDLDRFKNINDTFSHTTGDKLLQSFSFRILSSIEPDLIFARWGGDEFTLIIPEIDNIQQVEETTKLIMKKLKEPFIIDDNKLHISTSIGIAIYPQDGKNEEALIKNADAALYRAKELGRNNHQFYDTDINQEKLWMFQLENYLHSALTNNEFYLNYHPQMDLQTGQIQGLEVLLRWQQPELGNITPDKFIPIAEETGLIIPIGEWVLETACRQHKIWRDLGIGDFVIAVNVSAKQFQQENFVDRVKEILNQTGLEPQFLELEITETMLIQDIELTNQVICELSKIAVQFSLDDFGTGYSSLSYLKKFPFKTIKIDKSFVKEIINDPQNFSLISAIITLGQGFGMKVIAEGVETQEQLNLLRQLGCDKIQGYYLTAPLSAEQILDFIRQKSILASN